MLPVVNEVAKDLNMKNRSVTFCEQIGDNYYVSVANIDVHRLQNVLHSIWTIVEVWSPSSRHVGTHGET